MCDGIRLCRELSLGGRSMEERLRGGLNLEEASVCLEDFTCFRVKERVVKSIKSLVSKRYEMNGHARVASFNNVFLLPPQCKACKISHMDSPHGKFR